MPLQGIRTISWEINSMRILPTNWNSKIMWEKYPLDEHGDILNKEYLKKVSTVDQILCYKMMREVNLQEKILI